MRRAPSTEDEDRLVDAPRVVNQYAAVGMAAAAPPGGFDRTWPMLAPFAPDRGAGQVPVAWCTCQSCVSRLKDHKSFCRQGPERGGGSQQAGIGTGQA